LVIINNLNLKIMLTNAPEVNSIGAGAWGVPGASFGGGVGGGIGAFGLIGLLGIDSLGGRRRGGDDDCDCNKTLAILAGLANNKDTTVAEGRNVLDAVCDAEKTNLQQFYAAAIQASNLQQATKDQATAFAIVNDKRFDDLSIQAVNQTAAILARINDVENQNLRDQLFEVRRRFDAKETELHITNTNINTNAQAQAQFQIQTQRDNDLHRRLDAVFGSFNQLNSSLVAEKSTTKISFMFSSHIFFYYF
jgi:hypothetical protein